jgi:hypothetical protein
MENALPEEPEAEGSKTTGENTRLVEAPPSFDDASSDPPCGNV